MNVLLYALLVASSLALIGLAYNFHKKYYILPYLFFVRFPLVIACGIFALPIVANWFAPTMLKNAFELNRWGAFVVGLIATYGVFSILYNLLLIWHSVPLRAGLVYRRSRNAAVKAGAERPPVPPKALLSPFWNGVAGFLLLPSWLVIALNAEGGSVAVAIWFGAGLALACGLRSLGNAAIGILSRRKSPGKLNRAIRRWLYERGPRGLKGFILSPFNGYRLRELHNVKLASEEEGDGRPKYDLRLWIDYLKLHVRAFAFFATWMLIVLLGFFAKPTYPMIAGVVPALAYLLILITAITWILGFLSFTFDTSRLPIFTVIVGFLLTLNLVVESGYTYRVLDWQEPVRPVPVETALDAFAAGMPLREGPMVLVAASGGGITAALWTTTVLEGLGEALSTEDFDFHQQVAMLSAVSGGAVGAVHYVNAFGENGASPAAMEQVAQASATSSLAAAVWGMAYPDFLRQFTGTLLGTYDRARAQEEMWDRLLKRGSASDEPDVTVGQWAESVAEGRRPIAILNATFEETGERLLIAPVTLSGGAARGRHNWLELLPESDIRASTAARLSATFPYVTPQARPQIDDPRGPRGYHVADGGFYDNSGIVSLLDALDLWLKSQEVDAPRRDIVVIEIRAGSDSEPDPEATPKRRNVFSALAGPLKTLFSVRTSSQLARNRFEVELFAKAWESRVNLRYFTFELSGDAPLSWHLSPRDIAFVRSHWPTQRSATDEEREGMKASYNRILDHNTRELERLGDYLGEQGIEPPAAGPSPAD